MKDNVEFEFGASQSIFHPLFLQEESKENKVFQIQEILEKKMKRLDFEIQVLYDEQMQMIEETFEKNQVFHKDILETLDQLNENGITTELLGAYERAKELDCVVLLTQNPQNPQRESLKMLENDYNEVLQALDLKPFCSELIKQVSAIKHYGSKAELMFIIFKTMSLFRLQVDDEDWLNISFAKGSGIDREVNYKEVRNIEKIDLKIEDMEEVEVMLFGLSFLLENCLEKVSSLCFSFTGRYVSNQEAERFNNCDALKKTKFNLILDFSTCAFETEETPLKFMNGGVLKLEDLEGLRWLIGDSNVTQKTVNEFCQLVGSKMKNLRQFVYDGSHLPFLPNLEMNKVLLDKASELMVLELGVQQTPFTDNELIIFSEKVLPELGNIDKLKLWFGYTQITNIGLLSLFQSITGSCASRLKAFLLGAAETRVTDESFTGLTLSCLPLMKNLEDFSLYIQRTCVSDKSLIDLCKNIKYFASKLKKFELNVGGTAASDAMMDVMPLKSMGQINAFHLWLNRTRITDKGLSKLFSSMAKFSSLERFELNCSETVITDESLAIFASKTLLKMTNLKKINFYANKTKVQDVSLKPFFKNLSKCHKLHKIAIWLNETRIREESLLVLAESIPLLVNLTHLSLSFHRTKLEDFGVSRLCESLKSVAKNLELLKLGLDNTKVTDNGVLSLGNETFRQMRSLKELSLSMSNTQAGSLLFGNLKENMASLDETQAWVGGSLIKDQSLSGFASPQKAESLRSIELLVENIKVSDLNLVPFMQSLKNKVYNVNKLDLRFQNTKITDETVKALSTEVLMNMRNLQDFQLNLALSQVTDASMFMFVGSLTNSSQRLKKLVLQFNYMIGDSSIRMLADKVLPNLGQVRDLKLTWTGLLSSSTMKALCLNASRTIKNIKTFQISSSQLSVLSCSNRASHECLEDLSFELNRTRVNDSDMREILESFEGGVFHVKNFAFRIEKTSVSNSSIKTLTEKLLLFMHNLDSVKLALGGIELSDEAFCFISCSFKNFASKIKEFQITLSLSRLRNFTIYTFANCGLANMTNLEDLDIEFYFEKNYYITSDFLIYLFDKMQNCVKKLKDFSLSMFDLSLPSEAIQALATKVFPNLSSLTSLFLGLERNNLTDSESALFFSGFKGVLEKVKFFGLVIQGSVLTDQTFDYLWANILPQLKSLKNFVCYVDGNGKMNDKSFIQFNKSFQEVANQITNLTLAFENTGISTRGMKEFALQTLAELKSLKALDINFEGAARVDDEAAINLFDGLGRVLGRLSLLKLRLGKTGVTDAGIEALKKRQDLEVWKKFYLNFSGNNLSQKNKKFLEQFIKK